MKKFLLTMLAGMFLFAMAEAQFPLKVYKFKTNLGGADTVAHSDTSQVTGHKTFAIGSQATGAVALNQFGAMYYEDITYFVRVDSVSTTDSLIFYFETKNYQDSVFRVPFTQLNALGTATVDAESTSTTAATRLIFIPSGNSVKAPGPMRNVRLVVRARGGSVRCIYTVSAQARSRGGD